MTKFSAPVVLIVEDEPLIRLIMVEAFLDAGFVVVEAEHAADALRLYDATPADVLFTDINMPGEMNGIDLAEHLLDLAPGLRIVIASALPVLRSVDHLPAIFVAKPYSPHAVTARALELLAA